MAIAATVSRWVMAGCIASGLLSCNAWTVLSQQDRVQPLERRLQSAGLQMIANLSSANLGKEIYLKGKVRQQAPFLGGGAYELEDATGRIWVITQGTLPRTGTEILVAGQLNFHELQVQQQNFGELFLEEIQTLDPALAPAVEMAPPQPPKKERLNLEFLPHKDNQKF